ncbi:MAG: hypothetical protein U0R78_10235 [Nocardioidaceae bacterium]
MAVHGMPHLPALPDDHAETHTQMARWAVGLAELAIGVVVAAGVLLGVAWLVGGADAIEDTWVGMLSVAALYGSLLSAALAWLLAVGVRIKHEAWTWLWLPLATLPALVVLLLLGELFIWE